MEHGQHPVQYVGWNEMFYWRQVAQISPSSSFFAICSKIDLGGAGIIVLGWVETMWKEENTGVKISFRVRGLHFAHRSYWKFEFDPHLMWESWLGNVLISLIWSIGERFMRCRVWGWGERVLFGKGYIELSVTTKFSGWRWRIRTGRFLACMVW